MSVKRLLILTAVICASSRSVTAQVGCFRSLGCTICPPVLLSQFVFIPAEEGQTSPFGDTLIADFHFPPSRTACATGPTPVKIDTGADTSWYTVQQTLLLNNFPEWHWGIVVSATTNSTGAARSGTIQILTSYPGPPPFYFSIVQPPTRSAAITVTTNLKAATFTITGPKVYTGSGTSFVQDPAPPGSYTITFGNTPEFVTPSGFKIPPSITKVLAGGGTISFDGTYEWEPGCVTDVTRIGQCDGKPGPWGSDVYAHHYATAAKPTICRYGCALTSLSMDLTWAGVTAIPDFTDVFTACFNPSDPTCLQNYQPQDPHYLNLLMTRTPRLRPTPLTGDYNVANGVAPDNTVRDIDLLTKPGPAAIHALYFSNRYQGASSLDALHKALCQGGKAGTAQPVMIGVPSQCHPLPFPPPGHYVLVTGEIIDPVVGRRFAIADPVGKGLCVGSNTPIETCEFLDCAAYNNKFVIWGAVTDPDGDVSGLNVNVGDAAEIVITNQSGQRTGRAAAGVSPLQEIPGSSYFSGSLDDDETGAAGPVFHSIQLFQPATGSYRIDVLGLKAGLYALELRGFSEDGSGQAAMAVPGIAGPTSSDRFEIAFSKVPGEPTRVSKRVTFSVLTKELHLAYDIGQLGGGHLVRKLGHLLAEGNTALANGEKGEAVRELRRFLKRLELAAKDCGEGNEREAEDESSHEDRDAHRKHRDFVTPDVLSLLEADGKTLIGAIRGIR